MCIPVPIIFSLAKTWQWMIPGYILYYLSMFSNTPMQAYIADKADKDNVSSTFTIVFSSFSLGSILAPALGGWLTRMVSLQTIFLISFGFYALSTLTICWMSPDRPHRQTAGQRGSWKRALKPELISYLALFTLVMAVANLPLSFVTPYMQDVANYDLWRIGLLGSLASLGSVLLAPVIGRLGDRYGVWLALSCSLSMLAVAYGLQLASNLLPMYAVAFLVRGGSGSIGSLMTSQVGKVADKEAAGMSFAFYNLSTSLGATVAPYVAGQLYTSSPRLPFLATTLLAVTLAAYFLLRHRAANRRVKQPATA
jgi:predicted MFS family arabinose efflux permease